MLESVMTGDERNLDPSLSTRDKEASFHAMLTKFIVVPSEGKINYSGSDDDFWGHEIVLLVECHEYDKTVNATSSYSYTCNQVY